MQVLVVNAGSSSLKVSVLGPDDELRMDVEVAVSDPASIGDVLEEAVRGAPPADAAGHRVVHGGAELTAPLLLGGGDDERLERLADLAPLHNPPALAAIRRLQALRPGMPEVACFDTAFHATMPAASSTYALPEAWAALGLRRFGFHGLSHAWASRRAAGLLGRSPQRLRLVTAHLGAGASLAAVAGGVSVDTTMGFTPLEGLVMATRAGSVDPGLLVWVLRHEGLTVDELEDALTRRAGLLGLSGSADLRRVIEAADEGDERGALAYDVYLHRLRGGVAAMAAAMGGTDGLVFTGGAGEHSARLRRDACEGLGFLGLVVDDARNDAAGGDGRDAVVSPGDAHAAVVVVHAREDLEIARQVRAVLAVT
ncbi:MAG: acetate/propionate family kinase [Acidimicrobiales bacterium]